MKKSIREIADILEDSNKADIIEQLGAALDTEGARIVIVTGIPNKDTDKLDISVLQSGHLYAYEQVGFIEEALQIVEHYAGGDNEEER